MTFEQESGKRSSLAHWHRPKVGRKERAPFALMELLARLAYCIRELSHCDQPCILQLTDGGIGKLDVQATSQEMGFRVQDPRHGSAQQDASTAACGQRSSASVLKRSAAKNSRLRASGSKEPSAIAFNMPANSLVGRAARSLHYKASVAFTDLTRRPSTAFESGPMPNLSHQDRAVPFKEWEETVGSSAC